MHIKIKKGLDIPITGKPEGRVRPFTPSGQTAEKNEPKQISLNLAPFEQLRFKLEKKVGDRVKLGEPVCWDKARPDRMFVAPAAGVITDVRRGLKRRLIDIVIDVDKEEELLEHRPVKIASASREEILKRLLEGGAMSRLVQRPFCVLADPEKKPKSIFIKAVESAPFVPPAEMQVEGHEEDFQLGLDALAKLTEGKVHLVYRKESGCKAFTEAKNVERHTAEGPHPVGTHSLHIQKIDPIRSAEEVVWTADVHDVIVIGKLLAKGKYETERVAAIAGPGVVEGQTGYFRIREGTPIAMLAAGRAPKKPLRFISGDPLTGTKVGMEDFLGYFHYSFSVVPESVKREFLHFFRLGGGKYSFSRAYLSGHRDNSGRKYFFNTSLHGEERAFIDGTLYSKVMPLDISTMPLVKSVMAEDFDLAEQLGLLEVAPEDFALPTFVCPSKMEMTEIMKQGIRAYGEEMFG